MSTPVSTSTLLDVGNSVLTNVGERPQVTLNNTLGSIVKESISDALVELSVLNDWQFTRALVLAESWSNDTANLTANVNRVRKVYWDKQRGYYSLPFIPLEEYLTYSLESFNTDTLTNVPRCWTYGSGFNEIRVNPYPTDSTQQARVLFEVQTFIALPSTETNTFSLPEAFVNLVKLRASATFALRHLSDTALQSQFSRLYETALTQMRNRGMGLPSSGYNLYRGRRQ